MPFRFSEALATTRPAADAADDEETTCFQCGGALDEGDDCPRCTRCDTCGELLDEWGDCNNCGECLECGEYVSGGRELCEDCEASTQTALIHEWNHRPTFRFHGRELLQCGFELEIDMDGVHTRNRLAHIVCSEFEDGLAYMKLDGSLNYGFEIVTHPMSWPYALAHYPWGLLPQLEQAGAQLHNGTGLHVHVRRKAFRDDQHRYHWLKFIYRNRPGVVAIAGRDSNRWASFNDEARRAIKDRVKRDGARGGTRYCAINLTNANTFEMRVFAASLRPEIVRARVSFAFATVEYAETLTAARVLGEGGWSWTAFRRWIFDRRDRYADLADMLGYIGDPGQAEIIKRIDPAPESRTQYVPRRAGRQPAGNSIDICGWDESWGSRPAWWLSQGAEMYTIPAESRTQSTLCPDGAILGCCCSTCEAHRRARGQVAQLLHDYRGITRGMSTLCVCPVCSIQQYEVNYLIAMVRRGTITIDMVPASIHNIVAERIAILERVPGDLAEWERALLTGNTFVF